MPLRIDQDTVDRHEKCSSNHHLQSFLYAPSSCIEWFCILIERNIGFGASCSKHKDMSTHSRLSANFAASPKPHSTMSKVHISELSHRSKKRKHASRHASSTKKAAMPNGSYPPPHVYPNAPSGSTANRQLIATEDAPSTYGESAFDDLDGFFGDSDLSEFLQSADPVQQDAPSLRHSGVQALQRHKRTNPPYYLNKGIFSDEQKAIIEEFSNEIPSSVMQRLRDHNPSMPFSYRQIKGAVENERRKKNRREANGPWTEEELDIIKQNMETKPKDLLSILRESVPEFRKNVDQVRDMKSQLTQKAKRWTEAEDSGLL